MKGDEVFCEDDSSMHVRFSHFLTKWKLFISFKIVEHDPAVEIVQKARMSKARPIKHIFVRWSRGNDLSGWHNATCIISLNVFHKKEPKAMKTSTVKTKIFQKFSFVFLF